MPEQRVHSCIIAPDDYEGVLPNPYKQMGFSVKPWPCHAWREKAIVYARRNNQTVFICESTFKPGSDMLVPRYVVRPDGHISEVSAPMLASQQSIERYMALSALKPLEQLYWLMAWKCQLVNTLPDECEVLTS